MAEFSDADFTSIIAAVNEAQPGDTIPVHSGTYTESIVVEMRLKIRAGPETSTGQVIVQSSPGSREIFLITADFVELSGFTLRGSGSDVGIYLNRVNGNTLRNNVIEGTMKG